jgi:hypothetical protein
VAVGHFIGLVVVGSALVVEFLWSTKRPKFLLPLVKFLVPMQSTEEDLLKVQPPQDSLDDIESARILLARQVNSGEG